MGFEPILPAWKAGVLSTDTNTADLPHLTLTDSY